MALVTGSLRRNLWLPCSPSTVPKAPRALCPKLQNRERRLAPCRAAQEDETSIKLAGEDAAAFSAEEQTVEQWTRFFIVLGVVSSVEVRYSRQAWKSSTRSRRHDLCMCVCLHFVAMMHDQQQMQFIRRTAVQHRLFSWLG